ncbi:hypothetical protein AGMMS49965_10820 [Bacteroidia bacterium]|nr:hypothetical protein AGMMS49965_10820 [Bacteroidia bacterium]
MGEYMKVRKEHTTMLTGDVAYETIETVTFDNPCKSYEYHLLEPEVGYFYRIEWQK